MIVLEEEAGVVELLIRPFFASGLLFCAFVAILEMMNFQILELSREE